MKLNMKVIYKCKYIHTCYVMGTFHRHSDFCYLFFDTFLMIVYIP